MCKFIVSVAMATNQIQRFGQNSFGGGLLKEHLCKTFVKISAMRAIKAYFHISHYKSMETLSCHSNESTRATAIKTQFL